MMFSFSMTAFSVILQLLETENAFRPANGFFGPVQNLPFVYYLGISLIILSGALTLFSQPFREQIFVIQTTILIVELFFVPQLIFQGILLRAPYALYSLYGLSIYVIQTGHINLNIFGFFFANPGAWILNSIQSILLGIPPNSPEILLSTESVTFELLYFLPLYVTIKEISGNNRSTIFAGIWIFYMGNFLGVDNTGDVALSYFFFLMALMIIVRWKKFGRNSNLTATLIVVIVATSFTHTLTSLLLSVLILPFAIQRVRGAIFVLLIAIVVPFAWLIYAAVPWVEAYFGSTLQNINPLLIVSQFLTDANVPRNAGSAAHQVLFKIELYSTISFLALGCLGLSYLFLKRKLSPVDRFGFVLVLATIAFSIFAVEIYHAEILQRAYDYLLPLVAYFSARLLINRRLLILFTIFLLLFTPIHLLISNEGTVSYLSQTTIAAYHFNYAKDPGAFLVGRIFDRQSNYVWNTTQSQKVGDYNSLVFSDGKVGVSKVVDSLCNGIPACPGLPLLSSLSNNRPLVIWNGEFEYDSWKWDTPQLFSLYLNDTILLSNSTNVNLVYTNGYTILYVSDAGEYGITA